MLVRDCRVSDVQDVHTGPHTGIRPVECMKRVHVLIRKTALISVCLLLAMMRVLEERLSRHQSCAGRL